MIKYNEWESMSVQIERRYYGCSIHTLTIIDSCGTPFSLKRWCIRCAAATRSSTLWCSRGSIGTTWGPDTRSPMEVATSKNCIVKRWVSCMFIPKHLLRMFGPIVCAYKVLNSPRNTLLSSAPRAHRTKGWRLVSCL